VFLLISYTLTFGFWLQAYTASFFAIPAFRWFLLQRRNAEIEERNRARLGWVAALERAGAELRKKVIQQFWSHGCWSFLCHCVTVCLILSLLSMGVLGGLSLGLFTYSNLPN
jgi:hypothetical protein